MRNLSSPNGTTHAPSDAAASAPSNQAVPADVPAAQQVLGRYRHRAPLTPQQISAIVASLNYIAATHGALAYTIPQYTALLRLLKAHCFPSPTACTFAQVQGAAAQLKARARIRESNPFSDELAHAIKTGLVTGFDPATQEQVPPQQQWAQLTEIRKMESAQYEKAVALVREREVTRDPQAGREWHERVFDVREAFRYGIEAPRPLDPDSLRHERMRTRAVTANRILAQVQEKLAKHESGEEQVTLREAALLEGRAREMKLLNLQYNLRNAIWHEHYEVESSNNRGYRGRARVLKSLQKDYERVERQHMRLVESNDRDTRRKRQLWINACVIHANKFRSYHRDVVGRGVKAATKALLKFHDEMARTSSRAEREAERARIQKLKEDDEEGYLELVRKTKNTRVLELLNQTDKYLSDLGVVVKEERVRSGIVNYDNAGENGNDTSAKRSYYETAHAIKEEVKAQSSLLVGGKLKEYQLQGIQWMVSLYNNRLNGILADEMGLGKTIQTLGLITYLMEKKDNAGPYLIIVPLSTIANWELEFAKWAPALTVVVFKGDKKYRRNLFDTVIAKNAFNVCLVTYEYVVRGKNLLKRVNWQHLIIDEGHRIKNHESKLSMVLQTYYTSRNRLLLTGTPLQNSLTELWALLNFLLPNVFKSAESFESWFAAPFAQMGVGNVPQNEQSAQLTEEETLLIIRRLHQVLRPFLLRRLKSDVLRMGEQLPEKQEHTLICDMSSWQKYMYYKIANTEKLLFTDRHGRQRYDKLSNPAVQLKKCVNHPYLFYVDHSNMMVDSPVLWRAAGKFDMLDACVMKFLRTGHRLLVFNQMTKVVDLQERLLRYRNIPFYRLDGNTRPEDRREMVADFNSGETDVNVFLLTTRAGGLGVNLQTADTVIIFDSDWNPSMDKQAQDRAHRIGQQKEVLVLRMQTHNSIEESINRRATFKQGLEQKIIGAGKFDEQSRDSERQEMLRELLRVQEADEESKEGLPTEEEINRMLARTDAEYDVFQQIDNERRIEILNKPKLLTKDEIPEWAITVPAELKQKSKRSGKGKWGLDEDEEVDIGPRKRRATKGVNYGFDQLTENQYMRLMQASENGEVASLSEGVRAVQGKRRRRRKKKVEPSENESMDSSIVTGKDDESALEAGEKSSRGKSEDADVSDDDIEIEEDDGADMEFKIEDDEDEDEDYEMEVEEDEEDEEEPKRNSKRVRDSSVDERPRRRKRSRQRASGASSDEGNRGSRRRRIVESDEDASEDGEIMEGGAEEESNGKTENVEFGKQNDDQLPPLPPPPRKPPGVMLDDELLMMRVPRKPKPEHVTQQQVPLPPIRSQPMPQLMHQQIPKTEQRECNGDGNSDGEEGEIVEEL